MDNYYRKYLKYKSKYITTNQSGGNDKDYLLNIKFINERNVDITSVIKDIFKLTLLKFYNNDDWKTLEKQIEVEINKLKEVANLKECNVDEQKRKWIKCVDT